MNGFFPHATLWRASLRARVIVLVGLVVLPVVGLVVWSAHADREARLREAEQRAAQVAGYAATEFDQIVDASRALMQRLGQEPAVREVSDPRACARALADVRTLNPAYGAVGIIGRDGRTVCSDSGRALGMNVADRDYFQRALRTGGFVVSGFIASRSTGAQQMMLAAPVQDGHGKVSGVMFLGLDLGWMRRRMEGAIMPAGASLLLVDGAGTVMAAFPGKHPVIGKTIPEREALLAGKDSGGSMGTHIVGFDGLSRAAVSVALPGTPASSAFARATVPTADIISEADRALRRDLLALGVIALLVLGAAWWSAGLLLVRPTRRLIAVAEELGRGNMKARTGLEHGSDELGQLALQFDGMASNLRRLNRALRALSAGNRIVLRAQREASLLEEMCQVAVREGGYWVAWVGLLDATKEKDLATAAVAGAQGDLNQWVEAHAGKEADGPAGHAIRTGTTQVARNVGYPPARDTQGQWPRVFAACALPLKLRGQTIGVLKLYAADIAAFDSAELELLEELAADLVFGIQTLRDRRQQEAAEERVRQMAYVDGMTGLPNRARLEQLCGEALTVMAQGGKTLAVMTFRLDGFGRVQNAVGFAESERLIVQVAQRLRDVADCAWPVARLVADRFAILVPWAGAQEASAIAHELIAAFERPFAVAGIDVEVNANIGVAVYPEHGEDSALLMRRADIACVEAHARAMDVALYQGGSESENPDSLQLMVDLRRAIDEGQLAVHYQGKVRAHGGEVTGAEALLRWHHPTRGNIPPMQFIAGAEETGLIRQLTRWVLNEVLRQQHAWMLEGRAVPVAVNLSGRNFRDPALVDELQSLLTHWQVEPRLLQIEITETVLMDDAEAAQGVLARMRALGLLIFIDDFGTGYSSLRYLASLPVDVIKIDRSFIIEIVDKPQVRALVGGLIDMGHKLGMKLVAEGVDDERQARLLREMGCDEIQGFLYGRPVPADAFQDWMARGSAG